MAREAMVTRSFMTTEVTVMCLNIETAEPSNETITIPKLFKDEKKLLKAVREIIDTDTLKAVSVVNVEQKTKLYGMSIADFTANAVELDPETRKYIGNDESEVEDNE